MVRLQNASERTESSSGSGPATMIAKCQSPAPENQFLGQIGIDGQGRMVDQDDYVISALFKLYPWEWLAIEDFGDRILPRMAETLWFEPVWKMMWSNKAVLSVLWEMFPGHPNLLEAYFEGDPAASALGGRYVRKPLFSREGANIEIVGGPPEVFDKYIREQVATWGKVVKEASIKAD